MKYDSTVHHRRSIRLQGYDYSQAGAYFMTICAQNRECLFGEIMDGNMWLNDTGRMVAESWEWLAIQYDHVKLDEWVIMPNHMHGIIVITDICADGSRRGGSRTAPTGKRKPIGRLVGAFKTVSTKHSNEMHQTPGVKLWQRNYWEHIVRDELELNRIREYIVNNPLQWEMDKLFVVGRFANRPYSCDRLNSTKTQSRRAQGPAPTEIRESGTEYANEAWMV